MTQSIDRLCVDTIRFLAVDAVERAKSGHPGMPMGAAPMAFALWDRVLKHNPRDPSWFDRDRFVLSAGHGSMLLYSLLHLTGYDLSLDEIKQFRQWGSKAPGHPERGHTLGVEITTGPLGQGIANAVGMAIAEAQLAARYNRPGFDVIDHATYALVSDGDLMEGVGAEAASLAGHLRLGKLTCLYDDNRVTLAAGTDLTFSEDRARRFDAYGWHTATVADGNDLEAIDRAVPGDTILLEAGATFSGNFVLRHKGASTEFITIQSDAADSLVPPAGVRITPAAAPFLAKLKSPNTMSCPAPPRR